jgi:small subunit ribosomal protein S5
MTEEKKIKEEKIEKTIEEPKIEKKSEEKIESKTDDTKIIDEKVITDAPTEEVEVVERKEIKKEEEIVKEKPKNKFDKMGWNPKTSIGKKIKTGEITDIDEILDNGQVILEPEIVDSLLEGETELLLIGQSKGKFGGGQRRIFKQTQKKTREGNKPKFATFAIYGNNNGYIGYGYGKAKETVPAREKAFRKSKLNIMKIRRGCGSWECGCGTQHSIPYKVQGKCSSVKVTLMPAPKGTGLCIEPECAKVLKLAGIKDVWSKTKGHTKTKLNLIYACIAALKNLTSTKILPQHIEKLSIVEGKLVK